MNELNTIRSRAELKVLEERGFGDELQKRFNDAVRNYYTRLESENNTRDMDMVIKGQIRGAKDMIVQINNLIKDLKPKAGQ